MINLIPKEENRKKVRGFYYRLLLLFLVMVDLSILILFVATLPSYFFSAVKNNIAKAKLEAQSREPVPVPDQETLLAIKSLNSKLDLVELAEKNKFTLSTKVINAIILNKDPKIKITDIYFEDDPLKGRKISIKGTAPSRELLLAFRIALEGNILFKHVDLPISNFVKGSDIDFYLSLIPA